MNKCKGTQIVTLLAAVLLVNMAFLPVVGAQAENNIAPQATEVNLTGQNVVFFNVSGMTPIENKSRFILQGEKYGTGCRYNIRVHRNNTEGNVILRELAIDPTTCQQLLEQGTPNSTSLGINKHLFTSSTTGDPTAQWTVKTTWYDPINVEVNHVSDTVNWNYDGTSIISYYGYDDTWQKSSTGWYNAAHLFQNYLSSTSWPSGLPGAVASTYDHMENDIFCALITTNVWYANNNVEGIADGSVTGWGTYWADGSVCSTWLHYDWIIYNSL